MTCKEHPKYELPNTPHAKHRYESAMKQFMLFSKK